MGDKTYGDRIREAATSTDLSSMSPIQRVQLVLENFLSDEAVGLPWVNLDIIPDVLQRFHTPLSGGGVKILEANSEGRGHARTLWEFDNHDYWGNGMSNLHGGAHATVFDFLTSFTIPILSQPDFWLFPGVSRTLNVTYLRPAPSGEPVLIECEVVHIGKRMCVLKGTMRNKSNGEIISTCEHHKVNNDPKIGAKM